MNRKNLEKLAAYLEGGDLKAEFDMGGNITGESGCQSAGCAIGHGPYAGIPREAGEHWQQYSYRAFHVYHFSGGFILDALGRRR